MLYAGASSWGGTYDISYLTPFCSKTSTGTTVRWHLAQLKGDEYRKVLNLRLKHFHPLRRWVFDLESCVPRDQNEDATTTTVALVGIGIWVQSHIRSSSSVFSCFESPLRLQMQQFHISWFPRGVGRLQQAASGSIIFFRVIALVRFTPAKLFEHPSGFQLARVRFSIR